VTYLLDTNVISEVRKRRPDAHVAAFFARAKSAELFMSVLTIGEIRTGIERLRRKDEDHANALDQWLAGLCASYADRIITLDAAIAEEWGRLSVPDPLPVIDGLLAATARVRGWTLVTRNVADLRGCGIRLLNPFEPAA
jgi:predicted nucleic acid-binding protein